MGDGRYYTYYQFFNIVFLTFLIMVTLVSIIINMYKNTKNKGSKHISVIFMLISLIAIFRFAEEVIVTQNLAYTFRLLQNIFFTVVLIMLTHYLIKYVVVTYYRLSQTAVRFVDISTVFSIILVTLVSIINKEIIIQSYSFTSVEYSKMYVSLLSVFSVLFLAISVILYRSRLQNDINQSIYKRQYLGLIISFLYVFPLAVYVLTIIKNSTNIFTIELMVFLFFTIGINLFIDSFVPYNITASIFPKVKDMILDYVFIIDTRGEVIYKNNKANTASFLKNTETIDINKIENMFNCSAQKEQMYDENFIKYEGQDTIKYFTYIVKTIKNKGKAVGEIITLTDISNLINMLQVLKNEQENSKRVNEELNQYSKIVYRLEKEREIDVLLKEIAKNQENALLKLKSDILAVLTQRNNGADQENIEAMITLGKDNLANVRKAVSTYMEYYGGRND